MKRLIWIILAMVVVCAIGFIVALTQTKPAITKTAQVTLDIRPSPDFTLEVTPLNIITFPDRTVAYNAQCAGLNGFAGKVTVSIEGLPAGVTAEFFPSDTFTLGLEPKGVQINVAIPNNQALVGVYTLTVTAESTEYN